MLRQQSNEEEEGQRKLGLTFQKKKQSTRRSPRTKEQIEEDKNKTKTRKKKEITAHWIHKENGRYETGGYKDREKHGEFHRNYWRGK